MAVRRFGIPLNLSNFISDAATSSISTSLSVSRQFTAPALSATCSVLLDPGMATTFGLLINQFNATCEGVLLCAFAIDESNSCMLVILIKFRDENLGLAAWTRLVGLALGGYLLVSKEWANGLYAIIVTFEF